MHPPKGLRLIGQHTRSYSVSVKPPRVYENKPSPRVYSEKKTFLYHHYLRLLQSTTHSPLIFLQHNKFSVPRLIKLRKEIAQAASRHATPSLVNPGPHSVQATSPPPTLSVIRENRADGARRPCCALSPRLQSAAAPSHPSRAGAQRTETETSNGGGAEAGSRARSPGPTEPGSTREAVAQDSRPQNWHSWTHSLRVACSRPRASMKLQDCRRWARSSLRC
jgi:hypothetical protein